MRIFPKKGFLNFVYAYCSRIWPSKAWSWLNVRLQQFCRCLNMLIECVWIFKILWLLGREFWIHRDVYLNVAYTACILTADRSWCSAAPKTSTSTVHGLAIGSTIYFKIKVIGDYFSPNTVSSKEQPCSRNFWSRIHQYVSWRCMLQSECILSARDIVLLWPASRPDFCFLH